MTATSRKISLSRPQASAPGKLVRKPAKVKKVATKPVAPAAKPKATGLKQARLGVRLDDQVKTLLQHAASLRGRSMTDFLVDSAVEAAERVIKDASVVSLAMEDARRFAEALLNPPKPNAALKSAARRYRDLTSL
ncbi:MAG: DUF1778 domain-containing protein [Rhodanobacter sp.]|jgi:uncharacterized protein (DUF1778 family)|uniref:type II toxin-antitoxin system TacA family antitoxin n=1 Tax=Rhodanobacter sp. KK11 TaxID=3083255 RepID=UPI002966267F|nr:DUF1778 domain-containing protein [Rhodanobacter sp. KK11]MDW2981282.1 DUF1778 domain-containing protein [Rhodanobacter sp. KK11]